MITSNTVKDRGFTLVEVLISLNLLSLVIGLLTTSLFAISQSTQISAKRMESSNQIRAARQFIQSQIEQIVPLSKRSGSELFIYFRGYKNKIHFTGLLPSHRGGGGLQFLEISLDSNRNEISLFNSLARKEKIFERINGNNDWQENGILKEVDHLQFSYYGQLNQNMNWHDEWPSSNQLPHLIKIEVNSQQKPIKWLPLVIELRRLTVADQPQWVW